MATRTIKFQYFRTCLQRGESQEVYDFNHWIQKAISVSSYADRVRELSSCKYRVENILRLNKIRNSFIAIRFMKLDEYAIPNISTDLASSPMELEDDEYVGLDVNAIYDEELKLILVQKNRGSLTIPLLEDYINTFMPLEDGSRIRLLPIVDPTDYERLKKTACKKIEMNFGNFRPSDTSDSKNFAHILDIFNQFEGLTGVIHISVGKAKKGISLNQDAVQETVHEIQQNSNLFSKAQVHYTDANDTTQVYDLFENILLEKISFNLEPRKSLAFEYTVYCMGNKFSNSLPRIYHALGMTP